MLDALLNLGQTIANGLLWALVTVLNLLIEAVGALISVLLLALPSMPDAPDAPVAEWMGWLNWLAPVAPMVAALSVFVGLWLAFLVIRIPLKWVKAL